MHNRKARKNKIKRTQYTEEGIKPTITKGFKTILGQIRSRHND